MIQLRVNRLVITHAGGTAYDEQFHSGLNIIRGDNSSGKSTIANALFYALGGEYTHWLPEAKQCHHTLIEVDINGATLTLKREISASPMRHMEIFHGSLAKASESAYVGWLVFGYKRGDTKESFSQYLFKYLNIPEASTPDGQSITLNQLYRAIYVDQLSSITALLNNEDFDSPITRETIASLLFGSYDDALYQNERELKQLKERLGEETSQHKFLKSVLSATSTPLTVSAIEEHDKRVSDELWEVESRIEKLDAAKTPTGPKLSVDILKQSTAFAAKRELLKQTSGEVYSIELAIQDSEDFMSELRNRMAALEESVTMRSYYQELPLTYCPACLKELSRSKEGHCFVCKEELTDNHSKERLERMRIELVTQLNESNTLQRSRRERLHALSAERKQLEKEIDQDEREYSRSLEKDRTKYDRVREDLLVRKGEIAERQKANQLKRKQIDEYVRVEERIRSLAGEIGLLERKIGLLRADQANREREARARIEDYALQLLRADVGQEGALEDRFPIGKSLTLDFAKNTFFLDGRNQFSASSMVYLKNVVRFSMFFASLDLEYFRLPRFILCDNVEDKGMNPARSHRFQETIAQLASAHDDAEYQIIFTTSMVSPTLNIPQYVVGDSYGSTHKSLHLIATPPPVLPPAEVPPPSPTP